MSVGWKLSMRARQLWPPPEAGINGFSLMRSINVHWATGGHGEGRKLVCGYNIIVGDMRPSTRAHTALSGFRAAQVLPNWPQID